LQKTVVALLVLLALVVANFVQLFRVSRSNAAVERSIRQLTARIEEREVAAQEYPKLRERLLDAAAAGASRADARAECPPGCLALNGPADPRDSRDAKTPRASEAEKAPPRPEAVKAFEEGTRLIDQGLARGAWTRENVYQMKRWMSDMDNKDREEIIRRLIGSVNAGKLRPPPGGLLF
jgi:hypothetical protein